ncbi:MAG: MarR family transcriptional regulator [Sulfitobacter sp.]
MTSDPLSKEYADYSSAKHPPVQSIEDVFTFKMNQFVTVNEREGHRWAKKYFDLSLNEWRVFALIKAHAPVRASDVADQMLMDKSQLSRLI